MVLFKCSHDTELFDSADSFAQKYPFDNAYASFDRRNSYELSAARGYPTSWSV